VRYLLEQLTGPMVEFRKRGPDGWCTYEDNLCAMTAHDILRDHRIEGIRLVVEVVSPPALDRVGGGGRSIAREPIRHSRELEPRDRRPARPEFERRSNKRPRSSEGSAPGKLFVGNLSYGVTKRNLRNMFEQYGVVTEINLPRKDGKLSGYGFIHFENEDDAQYAQRMMDGRPMGNRNLRVEMSTSAKKSDGKNSSKRPRTESRYDAPIKTEEVKQERPINNPYAASNLPVTSSKIEGANSFDNLSRESNEESLGDMIGVSISSGAPFELV